MRILTIAYYYSDWRSGGTEQLIVDMSKYLVKERHLCFVAVPSTARTKLLEEAQIEYFKVGNVRNLNPFQFLKSVTQIASVLVDNKIDLVQLLTFRLLIHAYIATKLAVFKKRRSSQRMNLPVVLIVTMDWEKVYRYLAPFLGLLPKKIITFNKFWGDKLKKIPFIRGKIVTIPNSIDISKFTASFENRMKRKDSKALNSEQLVGTVSRLIAQKGINYFLEAAKLVLERYKARFWIVGEGQEEQKLKTLARQLGIEKQVTFLGRRNDIPQIFEKLDIFVLLSFAECMSASLLEAMASGVPVVATDVQGNSEAVLNGVNGILVPFGNVQKTAEAIETLLLDQDKAYKMGQAGRKRVEKYFDFDNMMCKIINVFEGLIYQ